MNTDTLQERKDYLSSMEKKLRLAGQKLDMLWMEARNTKGQERTNIHKQIAPIREKQRLNRKEHELLKKSGDPTEKI